MGWVTWCVSCLLCKWTGWNINKCWRSSSGSEHSPTYSLTVWDCHSLCRPCVSVQGISDVSHQTQPQRLTPSHIWSMTRDQDNEEDACDAGLQRDNLRVTNGMKLASQCCDSWSCPVCCDFRVCMVMRDWDSPALTSGQAPGNDNIRGDQRHEPAEPRPGSPEQIRG